MREAISRYESRHMAPGEPFQCTCMYSERKGGVGKGGGGWGSAKTPVTDQSVHLTYRMWKTSRARGET